MTSSAGFTEHTVHTVHTCANFLAWLHTFWGVVRSTFGVSHTGQKDVSGIEFSRENCAYLYFRFFEGRTGALEGAHDAFCAHFKTSVLKECAQSAHKPYMVHTSTGQRWPGRGSEPELVNGGSDRVGPGPFAPGEGKIARVQVGPCAAPEKTARRWPCLEDWD